MAIRCKFEVVEKSQRSWGHGVKLAPVSGTSEENKAFFKATPSGEVTFLTINENAADQFVLGQSYYIDFTEAP